MTSAISSRPESGAQPAFPGDRRILFGHQSVGIDILRGIRSLSASAPVFDLAANDNPPAGPGIFHFRAGRNRDPVSKIDDFVSHILAHPTAYDAAAMKLCYVDVDRFTDTTSVFDHYLSAVKKISAAAPDLHIVHVTVPLRVVRLGLRSRIRLAIGSEVESLEDNLQRQNYNSLLRTGFADRTRLYDLADIEATTPDGNVCSCRYKNTHVPCLYPGFTCDGGHLNDAGSKAAASAFMALLDNLQAQRQ